MSISIDLYDKIAEARMSLERAETAMINLNTNYFNDQRNAHNTPRGRSGILNDFNTYRVYADIVQDYLIDLRGQLENAEDLARDVLKKIKEV